MSFSHLLALAAPMRETNVVGYWGPVDSLHTFCEQKYATHPMFAEFYNSFGSWAYVFASIPGLYATKGMVWQVTCGWWSLLVVGVGSVAFHATMRYQVELLDEIPMLLLIACALQGFHGSHPLTRSLRDRAVLLKGTLVVLGGLTALYLYTRIFGLFVTGFTVGVLAVVYLGVMAKATLKACQFSLRMAVTWIIVARVFWETEVHMCKAMPAVWPLHNLWHIFSCTAAYYMLCFMYYYRVEQLGVEGAYGALPGAGTSLSLPKPAFIPAGWHQDVEAAARNRLTKQDAVPTEGKVKGRGSSSPARPGRSTRSGAAASK